LVITRKCPEWQFSEVLKTLHIPKKYLPQKGCKVIVRSRRAVYSTARPQRNREARFTVVCRRRGCLLLQRHLAATSFTSNPVVPSGRWCSPCLKPNVAKCPELPWNGSPISILSPTTAAL